MWSDQEIGFWKEYLQAHHGLDGELERLDGEFDLNIAVRVDGRLDAVLKVMRVGCGSGLVGMQVEALDHLAATMPDLPVPRVIRRHDGAAAAAVTDLSGDERIAWVISAIDGLPLGAMRPHPAALVHEIGHTLGRMTAGLEGFDHAALTRDFKWHPLQPHWAFTEVFEILDEDIKSLINKYFQVFENDIESELLNLEYQTIHCDGNDYNLFVSPSLNGPSLAGVIDFGDMVRAPAVCDLATAAAYMVLDKPRPMEALAALVEGYAAARPMTAQEIEMIFPLMMVRLGVSLVNSSIMAREHPDDPYVTVSQAPALSFLQQALGWDRREVAMRLRVAAGLGITDSASRVCGWLGAKDWNPSLVNIYAVTSILWFFFAVALFGWFLYLGITDKWRRYFVSSVTPGWFWFSVFWQALWALVRLLIANIVSWPRPIHVCFTPSPRRPTHRSESSPSSSRPSAGRE